MAEEGQDIVLSMYLRAHDEFSGVLTSLVSRVEGAKAVIAGLSLGVAALGVGAMGLAIKSAADWNEKMSQIGARTTMTTAQIEQMSTTIQAMAPQTAASMDDLAGGYEHIANFGYRGAQATDILNESQKAAVATGSKTEDVANAVAGTMRTYAFAHLTASQAVNTFMAAAGAGNMKLQDFAESMGKAMAAGAAFKVPLADLTATMATLTQHQMNAGQASAAVGQMVARIGAPSATVRKELAALSVQSGINLVRDFSAAGLQSKGLVGILNDVKAATHGNVTEQQALFPAIRQQVVALTLAGNGNKDLNRIMHMTADTMAGRTNPAAVASARAQQELGNQLKMLKNSFHDIAITIGNVFLPFLVRVAQAVLPIVRTIVSWISHNQTLAGVIMIVVTALGILVPLALTLAGAITAIDWPLLAIIVGIAAVTAVVGVLIARFATLPGWLRVVVVAFLPIVGIARLIIDHWSQISTFFVGLWSSIVRVTTAAWTALRPFLEGMWTWISMAAQTVVETVIDAWEGFSRSATAVWNAVTSALSGIWDFLVQTVWGTLVGVWDTVANAWRAVTGVLGAVWRAFSGVVGPIWQALADAAGTIGHALWDGVVAVWTWVTGILSDVWQAIAPVLGGIWSGIASAAGFIGSMLWDGIQGAWTGFMDVVRTLWSIFSGFITVEWRGVVALARIIGPPLWAGIQGAWTLFLAVITKAWAIFAPLIGGLIRGIVTVAGKIGSALWTVISAAWHVFITVLTREWNFFAPLIGRLVGTIVAVVGTIGRVLWDVISAAWHAFTRVVGAAWTTFAPMIGQLISTLLTVLGKIGKALWDGITTAWTAFTTSAGKLWATFSGIMGKVWATFAGLAGKVIGGMWSAITTAWTKATTMVEGAFNNVVKPIFEFIAKIPGLMLKAGEDMMKSLADGIGKAKDKVLGAAGDVASGIGNLFKGHSPPPEGPLHVPPNWSFLADSLIAAQPTLTAAAGRVAGAVSGQFAGGGTIPLGITGRAATGGATSGGITVVINGGTYTTPQGMQEMATRVSEEIMKRVRLQGSTALRTQLG